MFVIRSAEQRRGSQAAMEKLSTSAASAAADVRARLSSAEQQARSSMAKRALDVDSRVSKLQEQQSSLAAQLLLSQSAQESRDKRLEELEDRVTKLGAAAAQCVLARFRSSTLRTAPHLRRTGCCVLGPIGTQNPLPTFALGWADTNDLMAVVGMWGGAGMTTDKPLRSRSSRRSSANLPTPHRSRRRPAARVRRAWRLLMLPLCERRSGKRSACRLTPQYTELV